VRIRGVKQSKAAAVDEFLGITQAKIADKEMDLPI
jgi:hypothetical protein